MRLFLLFFIGLVAGAQTDEEAALHVKRAAAFTAQSRPEAAAAEYQKALDIHRKNGDRFKQGVVLNNWLSTPLRSKRGLQGFNRLFSCDNGSGLFIKDCVTAF